MPEFKIKTSPLGADLIHTFTLAVLKQTKNVINPTTSKAFDLEYEQTISSKLQEIIETIKTKHDEMLITIGCTESHGCRFDINFEFNKASYDLAVTMGAAQSLINGMAIHLKKPSRTDNMLNPVLQTDTTKEMAMALNDTMDSLGINVPHVKL